MSQLKSVSGIPCLYAYTCKSGYTRYFVKTQCNSQIFRVVLDLPDNPSKSLMRREAANVINSIKRKRLNRFSFEERIQEYIDVHQLKPKTAKAYRSILRNYSFDDAHNAEELRKTLNLRINCCQVVRTVNAFYNWLIRNSISVANPAANVKMPKPHTRMRTLSEREIAIFYKELSRLDIETQVFGRLLLETGGRISTIYAIHIGDIDDKGVRLHNIKAGRDYRHRIPLMEQTLKLCEYQIKDQNAQMPLFSSSIHTLAARLRRLLDRLFNQNPNMERIVIHSLRHTAATLALQNGVPIEIVSRMLDHINLSTTYSIYANLSQEQLNAGFSTLFGAFHQ